MDYTNFKITRTSICSLERRKEGIVCKVLSDDRLCVIEEEKGIAIEVDTYLSYPYIKTKHMNNLMDPSKLSEIKNGDRVVCFIYQLPYVSDIEMKKVEGICKLLNKGMQFPDGNSVISNEEYIDMINTGQQPEIFKKLYKKMGKKTKK